MCGMLCLGQRERVRGVLFRTESCPSSHRAIIRFSGTRAISLNTMLLHRMNVRSMQVLKRDCVAALRRIFKLCDTNKDGVLDAQELNEFQVRQIHSSYLCLR